MKHALIVAALLALAGGQERKNRPFHMGVNLFAHDFSAEAFEAAQLFLLDHADLVSVKVEGGVPWPEALEKKPYAQGFADDLEGKTKRPPEKRLFLSATPLSGGKDGIAGYRGALENLPNPEPWNKKDFDDPDVARAYFQYCKDLIARFRPDYFAYGIDVNGQAKNPARWKKFVPFVREMYTALKKEHPTLPLILTINIETATEAEQVTTQRKAIGQVLPFTDVIAVSAHPYLSHPNPAKLPRDYFSQIASLAPGKPFAITETAFPAEDWTFLGQERIAKAAWQADYLKFCLDEAARLNGKFVVWMIPRDCDALHAKLPPPLNEFVRLWKDSGLLDGDGKPRKSFELWSQWLKLPKK